MFEVEIDTLKKQFEKIESGLSFSDAGAEGVLNLDAENVAERFVALHIGIMKHTLQTMELALDQISTCVEVTKTMFFYQDQIILNPEFWVEEDEINGLFCNNNRKMSLADMQFLEAMMHDVLMPLGRAYDDNPEEENSRVHLVNRYLDLVRRLDAENSFIYDLEERVKAKMPLFDPDQRPVIASDSTAEKTLKAIHMKSAVNAEMAIEQNLEAAKYFMAAVQLVQSRGCPEGVPFSKQEAIGYLTNRVGLILERCDALEDAANNRHGFTQIRFG